MMRFKDDRRVGDLDGIECNIGGPIGENIRLDLESGPVAGAVRFGSEAYGRLFEFDLAGLDHAAQQGGNGQPHLEAFGADERARDAGGVGYSDLLEADEGD